MDIQILNVNYFEKINKSNRRVQVLCGNNKHRHTFQMRNLSPPKVEAQKSKRIKIQ